MNIDIKLVPFSTSGSFLCISDITEKIWGNERFSAAGLYLRSVRSGLCGDGGGLARIIPMKDGKEVDFTYTATPWELKLTSGGGYISFTFDREQQIRVRGNGLDLKLYIIPGISDEFLTYDKNRRYLNTSRYNSKLLISNISGKTDFSDPGLEAYDKPKLVLFSGDAWEGELEEFVTAYTERERCSSYEECLSNARAKFEAYSHKVCEGGPERFIDAMRQAAYVNYSAEVENDGLLNGRVMLQSNNWMNCIWTWDCQFNAVETMKYDPAASWDNFASPFTTQPESGVLLDMICDHSYANAYTKPPVHGWALSRLHRAGILSEEQKKWAYARLLKWVNSWYEFMDWDHDGVCQYNHGNDSGWDNCTYFLCGAPIEGPDLSAYLVLCWDELADLAEELGHTGAAADHRARADRQLKDLIEHSWKEGRFHVYQSGTHNEKTDCDSLLAYLPIILGDRLPKDIFDKMAADLKTPDRFITPCGLATECINSKYYTNDGYWRGPVWAPAMMFIIYGLAKGGETAFAAELAERFCKNCAVQGFAENFSATAGEGLRDRAYTWTSSVFLILAKNYVTK